MDAKSEVDQLLLMKIPILIRPLLVTRVIHGMLNLLKHLLFCFVLFMDSELLMMMLYQLKSCIDKELENNCHGMELNSSESRVVMLQGVERSIYQYRV